MSCLTRGLCSAAVVAGWLVAFVGCAPRAPARFPLQEPLWVDGDKRPFARQPEPYFSPLVWDGANQTIFYPVSRFLSVDPPGPAVNVNALDEVPSSSWFENRIGERRLSPAEIASGACSGLSPLDASGPWTVIGAKPNGANPGFVMKAQDGRKYLLKFDGVVQAPRATSADVIVSKLYYAVGYHVPCNQIVFFERSALEISPDAEGEDARGRKEPITQAHLDKIFSKAMRLPDGRYRASASLFIEGEPLGPWTYQGRREDDPNDVIDHEERRELRGGKVIAAWVNHFDAREQNTMSSWIEVPGGGYVRHWYIDFGDCLGALWEPPMLGRRLGHSHYFDPPAVGLDFVTLGLKERPWDRARFGPSGRVFGYYRIENFDPDRYHTGYPNPAFARMREADAAWMARILAKLGEEELRAAISSAKMHDPLLEAEALRLLRGRRDIILRRYLGRLSPLSHAVTRPRMGDAELCLRDLAVEAGVAVSSSRVYAARAYLGEALVPRDLGEVRSEGSSVTCATLPDAGGRPARPRYLIVDVHVGEARGALQPPSRIHLYQVGEAEYRVVGLERPERTLKPRLDHSSPGELWP